MTKYVRLRDGRRGVIENDDLTEKRVTVHLIDKNNKKTGRKILCLPHRVKPI